MIPAHVPIRLTALAKMTGWAESTLRDACNSGKMDAQKVGNLWVVSLESYTGWINGQTGKRRGDDTENSVRQVESRRDAKREVDQRPKRGKKDGRAANAPPKARPRIPLVFESNGTELRVENGGG